MSRLTLLFFCVCLAAPTYSAADAFSYRESISGDLPDFLPAPSIFAFGLGRNVVEGRMTLPSGAEPFDVDPFSFAIPVDARLNTIQLGFSSSVPSDAPKNLYTYVTVFGTGNTNVSDVDANALGKLIVDLTASGTRSVFDSALPVLGGVYGLNFGGASTGPLGWSMDYRWTFDVGPVPEPPPILLLGIGVLITARVVRAARHVPS